MGAQTAVLRPLWTMLHVAALLLGLVLLWQASSPTRFRGKLGPMAVAACPARHATTGGQGSCGAGCGLGTHAVWLVVFRVAGGLVVAGALDGAVDHVVICVGHDGVSLVAAPWLLLRLNQTRSGGWGIRWRGWRWWRLGLGSVGWASPNPTGLWCA